MSTNKMGTNKKQAKTAGKSAIEKMLLGKFAVVRGNVAGVHCGRVVAFDAATKTVVLEYAYRLWRFYTRDKSGSISDVAANGLRPDAEHSIGARLNTVVIVNPDGLEVSEMSESAYDSVAKWENK